MTNLRKMVNMSLPLISVLMPAYNAEKYIKDALNSIVATQYPNLEIIVVNDGSTDNTAEIIENYPFPIRLYHQDNQGIPITRNRTLDLMTGDIFTFLDADDLWTAYKLKVQLPLLHDADVVLGQSRMIINQDSWLSLYLSTGVYHRSVLDVVGKFAEDLPIGEDSDWLYRAWEANLRIIHHNNVVHVYRRHTDNITMDVPAVNRNHLRILKRSLDRRRNSGNPKSGRFNSNFVETLSDEELEK
jgi:glycosyltransferase involved in cell wall biosynthesis